MKTGVFFLETQILETTSCMKPWGWRRRKRGTCGVCICISSFEYMSRFICDPKCCTLSSQEPAKKKPPKSLDFNSVAWLFFEVWILGSGNAAEVQSFPFQLFPLWRENEFSSLRCSLTQRTQVFGRIKRKWFRLLALPLLLLWESQSYLDIISELMRTVLSHFSK